MKLACITASTAALLLSSSALMAQSDPAQNLENVYLDVGGTAVQVPIAQAAEACALDEASLQQIAQTRLADSGLDPAVIYGLGNENPDAMASAGTTTDDTAAAEALGEMGGSDETSTAAADSGAAASGTMDSTGAASNEMASAEASGTMDSGTGSDMASADASGTVDSTTGAAGSTGSTDTTATADASGAAGASGDVTGGVQNVQPTAADTSAGADPMLQLAVCQVEQARATELGIDMSSAGSMGSTGTATE